MAILPGFPGLEADILVNDVARKEYPDPETSNEDSPSSVTTYIEAEEGAKFVVQLRRDHRFKYRANELCWSVRLDGKMVRSTLIKDGTEPFYGKSTIEDTRYQTDNGCFIKHFFFSTLTTSRQISLSLVILRLIKYAGDTPVKTLDKKLLQELKELGQITISVHRVITGEPILAARRETEVGIDTGDVSEKALKGKAISRKAK
jgi:hypothetical protein